MSVIVTSPEGDIFLFSKGADNVMRDKVINKEVLQLTDNYMLENAKKGFRTLMIAFKQISIEEYDSWNDLYNVL